jgi:hypothetical protein
MALRRCVTRTFATPFLLAKVCTAVKKSYMSGDDGEEVDEIREA